jgi:hypothetical protein
VGGRLIEAALAAGGRTPLVVADDEELRGPVRAARFEISLAPARACARRRS